MNPSFILGFIAGEGSFYVSLMERESVGKLRINPSFKLQVAENKIIYKIHKELGIGTVDNYNEFTNFRVQSTEECIELSKFVDENVDTLFRSTHKYEQYKLWKEVLEIVTEPKYNKRLQDIPAEEQKRCVNLAYQIPKSNNRKYDKQYWYDIIDSFERQRCGAERNNGDICTRPVKEETSTCIYH
jgi:hypothetical protein